MLRLTREQCRAVDQFAIEVLGIPGIVLMENAGRNAADHIARWAKECSVASAPRGRRRRPQGAAGRASRQIAVVCGRGNNGGDGFVIARHLVRHGFDVSVDLAAATSSLSGDAAINHAIIQKMDVPVHSVQNSEELEAAAQRWRRSSVLVDALLGTGFSGQVREPLSSIIETINGLKGPLIVAVDVPSGLDVDRGIPGGIAVRADRTVTFLAEKVGFAQPAAKSCIGCVKVADIGVPLEFILARLAQQSDDEVKPTSPR